jgi:3'-phosphoadenosine 5'-phosphosulfate sulfotransferase (PAPS reductase)/FAD synthetase
MKRTSYLGLALVVVLASWAIASASAYAAVEWKVAGTALKSLKPPEEKLTEEVKVVKGFTLKKKKKRAYHHMHQTQSHQWIHRRDRWQPRRSALLLGLHRHQQRQVRSIAADQNGRRQIDA